MRQHSLRGIMGSPWLSGFADWAKRRVTERRKGRQQWSGTRDPPLKNTIT